jgi:large subunit ribosomal protein L4
MKLKIFKTDGTESSESVELSDQIFGIEPNKTVLYEAVRSYMSNQRQGTAKTKGRTEVRGGGKKAYRQKGTGNARRGSLRSPLLIGGGTVFGPQPRDYKVKLSKKVKQLARKSALSIKASEKAVVVVEDFDFDQPKTKDLLQVITALKLGGKKVLILTPGVKYNLFLSCRNVPELLVMEANKPSAYEILNADVLLFQKSGVNELVTSFGENKEEVEA